MTATPYNSRWLLAALPLVCALAGCCCEAFPLPGEATCPTDARRLYCGPGQEAVRRCPCGPDPQFYGHKPTEWRSWPEGWRCGQYAGGPPIEGPGMMMNDAGPILPQNVPPAPQVPPPPVANPFRGPQAEELPASVLPEIKRSDLVPSGHEPAHVTTPPASETPQTPSSTIEYPGARMFPDTTPKPMDLPIPPQPPTAPTPPANEPSGSIFPLGEMRLLHPLTLEARQPMLIHHGPVPPDPRTIGEQNIDHARVSENDVEAASLAISGREIPPTSAVEEPAALTETPLPPPAGTSTSTTTKVVTPAGPPVARRVAAHLSQSLSH